MYQALRLMTISTATMCPVSCAPSGSLRPPRIQGTRLIRKMMPMKAGITHGAFPLAARRRVASSSKPLNKRDFLDHIMLGIGLRVQKGRCAWRGHPGGVLQCSMDA